MGKQVFERFPKVKRSLKRIYQRMMYSMARDKIKAEGNICRVSPDDRYEYFFGYYDQSPWDSADRYILSLRVKCAYLAPAPDEPAEIVMYDTQNENQMTVLATTRTWNTQQGCLLQWLGPDFTQSIIYNDLINGEFSSVLLNVHTGEKRILPAPIYAVSPDGTFALTLDFSRLHRLRLGYGYSNLPDTTKGVLCPDAPCVSRIDLATGLVTPVLRYCDLAGFERRPEMDGAEHKVNHIMINPSGARFMVLHRWFKDGRKHTRLVTAACDGTDLYNLNDEVFASHSCWKDDERILSFLRKGGVDGYYLLRDKTKEYRHLWPELNTDGHCTYNRDRSMVVTDTYPDRKRIASIYLCDEEKVRRIVRVFAPFRYDNEVRCDLHPRWNREGNLICFDSTHEGKRGVFITDAVPKMEAVSGDGPVRVLHIVQQMHAAGLETFIMNMYRNIDRDKVQFDFLTHYAGRRFYDEEIERLGGKIHRLSVREDFNVFKYRRDIHRFFADHPEYRIVHGHMASIGIYFLGVAKKHGVPVRIAHSHNAKHDASLKGYVKWHMSRLFKRNATHLFACSNAAGTDMFGNSAFTVVRNAIDLSRFAFNPAVRATVRDELGLSGKFVVGNVGRFYPQKNHAFLLDIFGEIVKREPESILVMAGEGPLMDEMRKKAAAMKIDGACRFLGALADVDRLNQAMDVFLFPTLFEGLGIVVVEAQTAGLPVVCSDEVPLEAKVAPNFYPVALSEPAWKWAEAVLSHRQDARVSRADMAAAAGYDVKAAAKGLQDFYLSHWRA